MALWCALNTQLFFSETLGRIVAWVSTGRDKFWLCHDFLFDTVVLFSYAKTTRVDVGRTLWYFIHQIHPSCISCLIFIYLFFLSLYVFQAKPLTVVLSLFHSNMFRNKVWKYVVLSMQPQFSDSLSAFCLSFFLSFFSVPFLLSDY